MIIKYGDLRILDRNMTTYNVGKNENDHYSNGVKKVKYSIFFNLVNGYRELVSFKTKKSADILCRVIDAFMKESGLRYSWIDGECKVVFDKSTGNNIVIENFVMGENILIIDNWRIDEGFIDINCWINMLGLEDEVI